jgi:hypothetical protein
VVVAVTRELQPPEGGVDAHQPYDSLSATAKQLAILQEHFKNLPKVAPQLVQRRALAVGTRPARYVPDVQASVRVALDQG